MRNRSTDNDNPDTAYAFQAELVIRGDRPFVPRPDPQGVIAADWDERVADLHYADAPEYATGHGVSADWERRLSSAFIVDANYGTRCSTVLTITRDGAARFVEKSFDAGGREAGEARFEFTLSS